VQQRAYSPIRVLNSSVLRLAFICKYVRSPNPLSNLKARQSSNRFWPRMNPEENRGSGYSGRLAATYQADLTSIFFTGFWASVVLGKVIVSTPFEKSAAILLRSTLPGSSNARWNEP
jgi:hypothetical protein